MIINLNLCYKMDVQSVRNSTFDENLDAIRSFFAEEIIGVNLQVQVEGFPKRDELNESVRWIMKDIKNQGSCTYRVLEGLFEETDIIEKKTAMLRYLLEKYFVAIYSWNFENKSHLECVHNYWGPMQFKYRLPIDVLRQYNDRISEFGANIVNLMKLSPAELATYVIPFYYKEIGWGGPDFLRYDAKKTAELSSSWLDKSLQGRRMR